jgi:hypothetical protein
MTKSLAAGLYHITVNAYDPLKPPVEFQRFDAEETYWCVRGQVHLTFARYLAPYGASLHVLTLLFMYSEQFALATFQLVTVGLQSTQRRSHRSRCLPLASDA